jgi:hypothetical protein
MNITSPKYYVNTKWYLALCSMLTAAVSQQYSETVEWSGLFAFTRIMFGLCGYVPFAYRMLTLNLEVKWVAIRHLSREVTGGNLCS